MRQRILSDDVASHAADDAIGTTVDDVSHAASGACSFTAATTVALASGTQAIGTVNVGQKVLAYNPKTHKMEAEPIVQVWKHSDDDLVDLTLTMQTHALHSAVTKRTSEVVHTNQKHPFLTLEHGFLPVAQVKVGMHVERADGSVGIVTVWKLVPGIHVMYNLEVAHDHTFTVGTGQWIVHNCNVGDPVHVSLPKNRYPQTAAHIGDATANGQPRVLTIARSLADDNRANSSRSYPMAKGYDRDEYPMAFTKEGGAGADVRYVDPSDNRGAGSFIAKQLAGHPDGTTFIIDIVDEWLF